MIISQKVINGFEFSKDKYKTDYKSTLPHFSKDGSSALEETYKRFSTDRIIFVTDGTSRNRVRRILVNNQLHIKPYGDKQIASYEASIIRLYKSNGFTHKKPDKEEAGIINNFLSLSPEEQEKKVQETRKYV